MHRLFKLLSDLISGLDELTHTILLILSQIIMIGEDAIPSIQTSHQRPHHAEAQAL